MAGNGATELANRGLQIYVKEICDTPYKSALGNTESLLQSLEKASHRVGIDIAFQYAEHFYKQGEKSAARGWLHHAKMHAKPIKINIAGSISKMKSKYKDRMPIFF